MRIKVIDKASGQQGTIPDNEFDSAKYTKIEQTASTPLPPITTTLGSMPSLGPGDVLAQAEVRRKKDEADSALQNKIFQNTVGTAGMIAGGLIGTAIAPGVGSVIGAGIGGGAGEGVRQAQASEDLNAGNIVKQGVVGAGSELLGLGVAKVVGKLSTTAKVAANAKNSKINDWGDDLVKSVIKPKVKASPTMASDIDEIMTLANKHGLTGVNAADAATKMDDIYKTAAKNVQTVVKDFTPDTRVVQMSIDEILPEVSDLTKSTTKAIATKLNAKIASSNGDDLLKLKYDLQKEIKAIYNPAHVATEEEAVKAVYHNAIDEYLKLNVTGAREGLETMSDLYKIAPGLKASMDAAGKGVKVPIPFLGRVGGETVGKGVQTITSKTGKFLQNVGRETTALKSSMGTIAGKIPSEVLPPITQGLVSAAVGLPKINLSSSENPVQNSSQQGNTTNNEQNNPQGNNEVNHGAIIPPNEQNYLTGYSPEKLYQAFQAANSSGDTRAASKLRQMWTDETKYQKDNTGGNKPLSAAASQVKGKADAGLNALDKMETIINQDPSILFKLAIPGSPGAREYSAYNASLTDALGGLRTGASVSPSQQAFYEKMVLKIFDSPATIKAKIEALRKELQGYANANIQDTIIPTETSTSLPEITY